MTASDLPTTSFGPAPHPAGGQVAPGRWSLPRRRSLWDLALLALGLNLWVTFLVLPALHLGWASIGLVAAVLLVLPLLVLGAGVLLRQRILLLGAYPLTLVIPPLLAPQLVGINVYASLSFSLVALSFVAYLHVSAALVGIAPPRPRLLRDLAQGQPGPHWRGRLRLTRALAVLTAVIPALFIFTVFLHPGISEEIQTWFPRRGQSCVTFLGAIVLLLWLAIFYAYFMVPLRAHIKGDPWMRHELFRIRREIRRGRPSLGFFLAVGIALGLMVLLVALRGCLVAG